MKEAIIFQGDHQAYNFQVFQTFNNHGRKTYKPVVFSRKLLSNIVKYRYQK